MIWNVSSLAFLVRETFPNIKKMYCVLSKGWLNRTLSIGKVTVSAGVLLRLCFAVRYDLL